MGKFSAVFVDRLVNADRPSGALTFVPERWSWMDVGGPDQATIRVEGPVESFQDALRLIGDKVKIFNDDTTAVWWGKVWEVEVSTGEVTTFLSLENVFNRVAVLYTAPTADGSSERQTTAWAEDSDSIARFGIREYRPDFEGETAEAEKFRDDELARLRYPVPVVRTEKGVAGGMFTCRGPWHDLGNQYFAETDGLEEHSEGGGGAQAVGGHYTATTISFAPQDDILDSASGLGALEEGDTFYVSGAAVSANNGEMRVKTAGTAAIETVDKGRLTEAAGASVTISRGAAGRVDSIAQSFTLSNATDGWVVAKIGIKLKRVGNPADNVSVQLLANSSGEPGSVLDFAEVVGSTLSDTNALWHEWTLSSTDTVDDGTIYWIGVTRTGAASLEHFYEIEVDEDLEYAGGLVKIFNGTSWVARDPDADMPFRVTGETATTAQIERIIEENAEFGGCDLYHASGINTWQWRDGDSFARDEAEELLALGRSDDTRLMATVTESYRVLINQRPVSTAPPPYILQADGRLRVDAGAPLESGKCIAGVWVIVDGLPVLDVYAPATSLYVAASEYDALSDRLNFETDGALSAWKGQRLRRG